MAAKRGPSKRRPARPPRAGSAPIEPRQNAPRERNLQQVTPNRTRQQHIEWQDVRQAVYLTMTGAPPPTGGRRERRAEQSREGHSVEDAISEAFRKLFEKDTDAPRTTKEAIECVLEDAQRFLSSNRRRITRRNKIHQAMHADALIDQSAAGQPYTEQECIELLTQMYNALQDDPEAQQLLYALLECDIYWHQNKLLADELGYDSPAPIVNIKKRIRSKQKKIMAQFPRHDDEGDSE